MLKLIQSKHDEIAALCRLHHVKRLSIFGSALRADFDPSRSDVDLRVEFDEIPVAGYAENYFALREAFADLFGRKVDLISAKKIRNPIFRRELESTQVALYAA
ncbi:MAG: nucleotidyltransferase domain-containing protein [Acidobacteriaceae bacterium]|jgi:hypothetical protein